MEEPFDPRSSLFSIYDAVHGAIDIRDTLGSGGVGAIVQLLNSPMVERLRRIKQLGYASHSYPSADHSRFAHAIGTMHMMRAILGRLMTEERFPPVVFKDLHECFPDVFPSRRANENLNTLVRHMLVAALLQDAGELPYGKATSLVYHPSDNLKKLVMDRTGLDVKGWSEKDIFVVAYIHDKTHEQILHDIKIDLPFLVFLITGYSSISDLNQRKGLRRLRHILDGEVDADRLDYVFRDAYHTVGGLGSSKALIESLLYYDERGPVFSDPGPVSDFLVVRAHLWTNVYFSPQNRFRMLLLITLLEGIKEEEDCAKEFSGSMYHKGLSLYDFERLDDISLTASITSLFEGDKKNRLNPQARNALDILLGKGPEYGCVWLPRPETQVAGNNVILPDDLFFDTFSNYQDHWLYKPNSIRITSERFKFLQNPIPLEECCGAFSPTFKERWSALPMPGSILLFTPKNRRSGSWVQLSKAIDKGALYGKLMREDPLLPKFPSDTRKFTGYKGPDIFISFTWADIKIVERIADALNRRNRCYYLLRDPFEGIGDDTGSNSINAVLEAEEILVLASVNYVNRYKEKPNENIAKEIIEMTKRFHSKGIKPIFLSVDDWREIKDKLPYDELGYKSDGTPYVGEPLRHAPGAVIEDAVDKVLKLVDERHPPKGKKGRK